MDTPTSAESPEDQINQLKTYLQTIMTKQEELKKILAVKHNKAAAARRTSAMLQDGSLRNVMVERDDENHTVDLMETPGTGTDGTQKRLQEYYHNVEELEKELEETTKLVNEVATALSVLSGQPALQVP